MNRLLGSRRVTTPAFVIGGLLVAVLLAFLIAPRANPNLGGLEKVAMEHGLDAGVTEHAAAGSPLADYGVEGVDNTVLSTGVAGLLGIAATFVVGAGLVRLARRTRRSTAPNPTTAA